MKRFDPCHARSRQKRTFGKERFQILYFSVWKGDKPRFLVPFLKFLKAQASPNSPGAIPFHVLMEKILHPHTGELRRIKTIERAVNKIAPHRERFLRFIRILCVNQQPVVAGGCRINMGDAERGRQNREANLFKPINKVNKHLRLNDRATFNAIEFPPT